MQFGARLVTHWDGGAERYNRAQLQQCPSYLNSRGWALVALALESGCETIEELDEWLADVGAISTGNRT